MPDTETGQAREPCPATNSPISRPHGRPLSMADVLYEIVTDWKKLTGFVVLCFLMIFTVGASIRLLVWTWQSSGLRATSMEISSSPKIILEQVTDQGREFFLIVQPHGWMNSGIPLEPGDEVEFQAQGQVNITYNTLNDHVLLRRRIELRLSAERARGDFGPIPDSVWLPERHYTDADRDSLEVSLPRSWLTPDGDTGPDGLLDSRYFARAQSKILPNEPYGVLIAAVHGADRPPMRYNNFSSAFAIGSSETVNWTGPAGTLWFTVNDVLDDQDDRMPLKFFTDNIGLFMVRVIVKHD